MSKLLKALAALSAAVAMGAAPVAPAVASPIRLMFTGVSTWDLGGTVGATVRGRLTFDPATLCYGSGDGSTSASYEATYFAAPNFPPLCPFQLQSRPLQVSGQAGTGADMVRVGGGDLIDYVNVDAYRNWSGYFNRYFVWGGSMDDTQGQSRRAIMLWVNDSLGAASGIFSDPDGGFDPGQDIDWFAPGSTALFSISDIRGGVEVARTDGHLTSVRIVRIPEPASLALVGVALAGVAAVRRRRGTMVS